ncbi:MAG: BREX-1 system phosphatase PglZ type B [Bryobacterales bacterium]|nr:BREX-1 system phosphatase PglZ type B [Bryobacterales bacterium]
MTTPLDLFAAAIRAKAGVSGDRVSPCAILWPDYRREWDGLIPIARSHIPELLVLGEFHPDDRTGPAIWLRCMVDRTIDSPYVPADHPPIIYLPGVKRGQLRAGEDCPEALRPLVELMYRGVVWHHPNGRDWNVRAFLRLGPDGVPAGPGLDIASDGATRAALLRAIEKVFTDSSSDLHGRLDASDFNRFLGVKVERDMLLWLGDPTATRNSMDDNRWDAFRDEAKRKLRFDPDTGIDVEAGRRMAEGQGRWRDVWSRFEEMPAHFQQVPDVLRRSRSSDVLLPERPDRWPDINDQEEASLQNAVAELPNLTHAAACRKVQNLEEEHASRRRWVWARMGRSPFATVLRPLACLAEASAKSMGGQTPDDIARVYAERGWQADQAAREALALTPEGHEAVIKSAIRHLHEPWLRESAQAFQRAVRAHPSREPRVGTLADENECILFVDGLRYELGRRLATCIEDHELNADVLPRWAAIPTVTATAKPAVTPVAGGIAGDQLGADFQPVLRGSSRPITAPVLRESMREKGYVVVGDQSPDFRPAPTARGWLEAGSIDRHGHHHDSVEFSRLVDQELRSLVRQVVRLIEVGWRSIRIVTDHGWLLLPNGLPMVPLSKHLTASKWARCAVLAPRARPDVPCWPWHWNTYEEFASPSGIACFSKRPEYAHGGLSVQECLIPEIRVTAKAEASARGPVRARIQSVHWTRMRCSVTVEAGGRDVTVDLRLGGPAGESVVLASKAPDENGVVKLVLTADDQEDAALVVVVYAPDGRILAQRATRKGDSTS